MKWNTEEDVKCEVNVKFAFQRVSEILFIGF